MVPSLAKEDVEESTLQAPNDLSTWLFCFAGTPAASSNEAVMMSIVTMDNKRFVFMESLLI